MTNFEARYEPLPSIELGRLPDEALLTRRQVAHLSGFTIGALKKWGREQRGPRVTTIEGRPRYRVADVREWLRGEQVAA